MSTPVPPNGNRPNPTGSPSLVGVSNLGLEKGEDLLSSGVLERRRLPRVSLTQEQFRMKTNGKVFSVSDLSCGGMALRVIDENDYILLAVGSIVEGLLNLRREKIPVRGQVRHLLGDRVGIEFADLETNSRSLLERFLDPRILGADLRPMPTSESVAGLWFHGSSGTDLWLERSLDGSLKHFLLIVLGGYVRWQGAGFEKNGDGGWEVEGGLLSTGAVDSGVPLEGRSPDEARGVIRFETHWLRQDPKVDSHRLEHAFQVLEASPLGEDLRSLLIRRLKRRTG